MRVSIRISLFFLLLFQLFGVSAQDKPISHTLNNPGGHTYAVVIGISQYDSADIPALKYSSRDAKEFALYLQSKAGGSVPSENIQLLLDSNANTAAVYNALYWLVNVCGADDLAYIYFAGHGDMENTTMYKLGFLLTSNTGPNNYINNALRIEDLNNYANTMSADRKARVIIITDACHSGKLAEKHSRAASLVGDQLRTTKAKEVRITACATNELSNEDEAWGGGRGVFSYYLVNGLKGLADKQHDGIVTTEEIRQYLDSSFANDAVIKENKLKQTPALTSENKSFQLALVDTASLQQLKKQLAAGSLTPIVSMIPEQPYDYFFRVLQTGNTLDRLNYEGLQSMAKEDIAFNIINYAKQVFQSEETNSKLDLLEKNLRGNAALLRRFDNNLVEVFHARGQEVISLYLKADEAELERRRYYNISNNGYDVYPKMFAVAMQLTDKTNYLYRILEVNKYYFTGVVARLKIPTVVDPKELIKEAFAAETKAFALEENAAYIHNELGILYKLQKDYPKAVTHFLNATSIAPEWAVPWANLIGVYSSLHEFQKAGEAFQRAKELQPGFQGMYVNAGILNEQKKNFLVAEELYRKSIQMNTRHYLPFERLGFVYMTTTQYALADSFFYEAALRKLGYHFEPASLSPDQYANSIVLPPDFPCDIDTNKIDPRDVITRFVWAFQENQFGNVTNAEKLYKQLIQKDKNNFLAFHCLAKILFYQQRWQEAELLFKFAAGTYTDQNRFDHYCDSLRTYISSRDTMIVNCLFNKFKRQYYESKEDHYFLGELYSGWNHFDEAVAQYKEIIKNDPGFIAGYYKLWQLYEKYKRYHDAEKILLLICIKDANAGNRELYDFYKRMITLMPDEAEWHYKAGTLLYQLAAADPGGFPYDTQIIEPDSDGKTITEAHIPTKEYADAGLSYYVPGTGEQIVIADPIFKPRTEAIPFLLKADSLSLQDETARADINDKIGDLYVWLNLPEKANTHYQTAVNLQSNNAGTKMKLVDTYTRTWQNSNALEQLDTLYNRREINFAHQLQLARFYIHSSRFADGEKLLADAQKIYPYPVPTIADLKGRSKLMSGKPKEALPFYQNYLLSNENDPMTLYSIASIYAQTGNKVNASKFLDKAIANGFHYGYVLRYDPSWKDFKNDAGWKAIIARFPILE